VILIWSLFVALSEKNDWIRAIGRSIVQASMRRKEEEEAQLESGVSSLALAIAVGHRLTALFVATLCCLCVTPFVLCSANS
jgi:hypothetical protein